MNIASLSECRRVELAHAFTQAKTKLATKISLDDSVRTTGTRYICYAINRAYNDCLISAELRDFSKQIVIDRMGCYCLEVWLTTKGGVSQGELDNDRLTGCIKLQATRHAWVDSLIAELS